METDYSSISIHKLLKKGKYEASIITTYNSYLPFYEDVILRKLQAAGCRSNVLLMDSQQLSECLNTPSLRPKYAGFDYTLLPIRAQGAFHPKIILLIGDKKGCLVVGSHNLTISGFGLNREITTRIKISSQNDREAISIALNAVNFINNWIDEQEQWLPYQLVEAVKHTFNLAPWLNKIKDVDDSEIEFLGSDPVGKSLLNLISIKINEPIKRITIIGPFFDKGFQFLKNLQKEFRPKAIFVGIEPSKVEMPKIPKKMPKIQFVNSAGLGLNEGYLHAKIIFMEAESRQSWLITGSANPSHPAWSATSKQRNAEAVIFHSGSKAKEVANNLGVNKINKYPKITSKIWGEIQVRLRKNKKTKTSNSKNPIYIAVMTKRGIVIPKASFDIDDFIHADFIDENQKIIDDSSSIEETEESMLILANSDIRRKIRSMNIHLKNNKSIITWVHQTKEILRRSESTRQAQFRAAMASLETDDPDLTNLLITVEKIIFDETPNVNKKATKSLKKEEKTKSSKEIESLAMDLKDTKKEKKRRRLINSGDLALIMDILIHNLGIGLERQGTNVDDKGRDEEDLIGSDDEEDPGLEEGLDTETIIKMCNNKVRNIVSRMLKQFERVKERGAKHYIPLVQLVAVLALFRQLRKLDIEKSWIPHGKTLVPIKQRQRLFNDTLLFLFGKSNRFFKKAQNELVDDLIDELSRLRGLLFWLANDCGYDFRKERKRELGLDLKKEFEKNIERGRLLLIAPEAARDRLALKEARKSILQTSEKKSESEKWFKIHATCGLHFTKTVENILSNDMICSKRPFRGMIAFVNYPQYQCLSVVLRVSSLVSVFDVENKDEIGQHLPEKLAFLKFPKLEEKKVKRLTF